MPKPAKKPTDKDPAVILEESGNTVKHGYKNIGNKNNRHIFLSLEVI